MGDVGLRYPRSYRTMEGFGIHTFRLINAEGKARFATFPTGNHWQVKPYSFGMKQQKLTGRDPDFHRRELWEAIQAGDFPEYELGFQFIPEEDELSSTSIFSFNQTYPGRTGARSACRQNGAQSQPGRPLCLKTNKQHSIQVILFLLGLHHDSAVAGRLFSDIHSTNQSSWCANFHEIPINRLTCPAPFQRDGMHRMGITPTRRITNRTRSATRTGRGETPPGPSRRF
ncbi:catalase [Shigella flexneri]